MDDADANLVPGYKLDRYELLCPIASGGMATVWLARLRGKRGFEKLFAIKMIKSEHTTDARFQEMFMDEARIASAIEHPNVAQILDLGEQDGQLYTVMEWVDGEALAKIHRLASKAGKPLPVNIALRIVADACAGLHAAHELRDADDARMGVIHRDVSPQNILVSSAGAVKVIDFGVAKAVNRKAGGTESGVVKGKVRYMAPEQVGSRDMDHRADIWAAGICLYELVTGTPPNDELSDIDVIKKLMGDDPVPVLGDVPPELAPLFARTLTRDPAQRFPTAVAMRKAIEGVLDAMDQPTTSDDVAEVLRERFPDLAKKRRAVVARAIEDAKKRELAATGSAPRVSAAATDTADAFAPTIASVPRPKTAKDRAEAKTVAERRDESGPKTTSGATRPLSEQVGERRGSLFPWVVAILLVGGIGASGWVANEKYHFTSFTQEPPPPPPAPKASASASTEGPGELAPRPSATPEPALTSPAASASEELSDEGLGPREDAGPADASVEAGARHRPWHGLLPIPSVSAAAVPDAGPRKKWNPLGDDTPAPTADPPPSGLQ